MTVSVQRGVPAPLRFVNFMLSLRERAGGAPGFSMSAEKAVQRAMKETGLSDFGAEDIQQPLRMLCDAITLPPLMTPLGRLTWRSNIVRRLKSRLYLEDELKRDPTLATEEIHRPWFVLGLPRSGTTLLHRLLAQDPARRAPLFWETMSRVSVNQRDAPVQCVKETERLVRALNYMAPSLKAIHEFGAELPEECNELLAAGLVSGVWISRSAQVRSWLASQSSHGSYRLHKLQLQILQRNQPKRGWVLKSPLHLSNLRSLLAVYPDACIVQTHRDPAEVLPSFASLIASLLGLAYSKVDMREIGQLAYDGALEMLSEGARVRSLSGTRHCFVDVQYSDLVKNPMEVVKRIYDAIGVELSDDAVARMRSFLNDNSQNKFGRHRYSLEEFGLDAQRIREGFAAYIEQFLRGTGKEGVSARR
jgi:hypothetical protein